MPLKDKEKRKAYSKAYNKKYRSVKREKIKTRKKAYYLAKKIEIGLPIAKILKDWNIEPKDGKKALRELQSRVYLVLINKNKIVSDETKTFSDCNA